MRFFDVFEYKGTKDAINEKVLFSKLSNLNIFYSTEANIKDISPFQN